MTRFAAGFVAGALLTVAALVGVALLDRDRNPTDHATCGACGRDLMTRPPREA